MMAPPQTSSICATLPAQYFYRREPGAHAIVKFAVTRYQYIGPRHAICRWFFTLVAVVESISIHCYKIQPAMAKSAKWNPLSTSNFSAWIVIEHKSSFVMFDSDESKIYSCQTSTTTSGSPNRRKSCGRQNAVIKDSFHFMRNSERTIHTAQQITQTSNELVAELRYPSSYRKGLLRFVDRKQKAKREIFG